MNTSPLSAEEFSGSVLAVPPLARRADLSLDAGQNRTLIRHIEAGGVRTLLYGGNANFYHASVHEYGELLAMLADSAAPATRVIPAIGPDFGKMMDQARVLRGTGYRTAMVLPMQGFTTPEGLVEGISRVVDFLGMPVTLYLKDEASISVEALGRLVDDGRVLVVKYAVVRNDPADDAYLQALMARITPARIVSGMGERPTLVHLAKFGLASFTTGSGCIAPAPCQRLFHALKAGDLDTAQPIYDRFMPLETLRDSISLIRVLHDAVTLSGLADMGPHLPLLSASPQARHAEIRAAASDLLAYNHGFAGTA
ncbi:dihydrodipicolinate synthase family protein [Variovorax fucosicus]|uniref:dihydrodipicolinate synthase family protein n=1 Tax=Variovorax fucosicus TaxID=3053517 RepID=UPI002577EB1F|nr:dihydrodipicolinate synthase family protein [Variovorax sp. J22G47]MDM0056614.1 dihydrodipicolinate synthase family protein [Variovorax sp. J22G47]